MVIESEAKVLAELSTSSSQNKDTQDTTSDSLSETTISFPRHTRYTVVVSCFVLQGLSCGLVHAWGVQQEYLSTHIYVNNPNKIKTLSYIGTLMYFGMYLWALFAGWVAEVWSYRKLCFIGVIFMSIGQLLASFCKEPWQLCLTQGILFGFGIGLVYSPTCTAPARWFATRRGLATGIAMSGVGIGGLITAPLTEFLVRNVGVSWSLRVSAIYIFVLGTVSCSFVRVPFQDSSRSLKSINWSEFKNKRFAIHASMIFFITAAYLTPYVYLPQFWVSNGITSQTASGLISVANAGSSVGRILCGFTADYIGVLNTLLLTLLASSIACLLVWPFATSVGVGVVMSLLYGFAAGGCWTMAPLAAAKLFGVDKLASNTGIFFTASAVGTWIGVPVANQLLAGPGHGTNYISMSVYIGVLWAIAMFLAFSNRLSYSKAIFNKE